MLPLLELLHDLALLLALGRLLGGLQARGGISLLALGNPVACLGVRLVSLALLYVAEAVYAHAFSFLIDTPDERVRRDLHIRRSGCSASVVPDPEKPKPTIGWLRVPEPDSPSSFGSPVGLASSGC